MTTDPSAPRDAVEAFWSFRSPYSYLAMRPLGGLAARWDVPVRMRPVYPLATRSPGWFKQARPQWLPYLLRDVGRLARMQGRPLGPLNPDPIEMDMASGEVDESQPRILRLTRLGTLVARDHPHNALAWFDAVSEMIWSGKPWMEDGVFAGVSASAGLDLADLERSAAAPGEAARLDAEIEAAEAEQSRHHWGVPLFVWREEAFFGQDRLDVLEWSLEQAGMPRRV